MNEHLYEMIKDLDEVDYMTIVRSHKKRATSEGEEDYEVICM